MTNAKTTKKRFAKKFDDLTPAGKEKRLAIYEKERKERGTEQNLFRLARPVTIKPITNPKPGCEGDKIAYIPLARNIPGQKGTEFPIASAYIKAKNTGLEKFYANLEVGKLLSVEYKINGKFMNIWNTIIRAEPVKKEATK